MHLSGLWGSNFVPLVMTTCTNRKRKAAADQLQMRTLPSSCMASVVTDWGIRLRTATELFPACEIYCGRGFKEAVEASALLNAPLLVVSAGLGLVHASSEIPPYECTIVHGAPAGVAGRVKGEFTASGWWAALSNVSPFSSSLNHAAENQDGPILAGLSDAYINMISDDLLSLPKATLAKLRLFTRTPLRRVPHGLHAFTMPYDDRLDGPDSKFSGTLSDFASRAMHHFAQNIMDPQDTRTACEHAVAVTASLKGWRPPEKVQRVRHDDAEMLQMIRRYWDDLGGHSLRRFRDDLNVACEQGRFRALSEIVRAERG